MPEMLIMRYLEQCMNDVQNKASLTILWTKIIKTSYTIAKYAEESEAEF